MMEFTGIFKWIIFQWMFSQLASAQDTCTYKIYAKQIIRTLKDGLEVTTLRGIASSEMCGDLCCENVKCSAAMYKDGFCQLLDCRDQNACKIEKSQVNGISSIVAIRTRAQNEVDSIKRSEDEKPSDIPTTKKPDIGTTEKTTEDYVTNGTSATQATEQAENDSTQTNSTVTRSSLVAPTVAQEDKDTNKSDLQSTKATASQSDAIPQSTSTMTSQEQVITESSKEVGSADAETSTKNQEVPVTAATLLTPKSTTTIKTTKTTMPLQTKLTVSTGGNQEIRLPKDSVTIHATVLPTSAVPYDYIWRLIKHPEDFQGTQSGIETETLQLTTLTVGDYEFKVDVSGKNAYGEAFVNVTVLPKMRVNQPPTAVIAPKFQELTLPTDSTLLDGSKSHDDDGITKYEWEEVQGPLQANINKDENGNLPNEKVLKITGLTVGNYTFKLTVTDTDKVTDSTQATIIVKKKVDNPPIANAGSNEVIHLPQNSAVLCGNDSTDDWGIVNYKWSLSADSKNEVVDMQGARSQCLELSNLEVGDYTFQLTVTDEAGQEDTAKVTIIVQPESNHPPVANAGFDQQLLLPLDNGVLTASLDGTKSSDDKAITTVIWAMAEGPQPVSIVNDNALKTTLTDITKAGKYTFTLTVTDEDGASSSDSVVITVKDEQPPVAATGPDLVLTLPDNFAMLDGSKSVDDYGIKEYEWTRSDKSPAAGYVLNHSDHQSVLHVAGLVQGSYTFVLRVTNIRGKSSTDEMKLTVLPDPKKDNLVELHLDADILRFDEMHKVTVVKQLEVLLALQSEDELVVRSIYAEHGTGHMVVLFYVKTKDGGILPATKVTDTLNSKLKSDVDFLEFKFLRADTFVCENLCSGHGRCHAGSHECECDLFWMENFFRVFLGDGKRNCDWSVLYVGIVCFILLAVLSCAFWFLACFCIRRRDKKSPYRRRKNHNAHDKARYQKLPMKPHRNGSIRKNGYVRPASAFKSNSIMRSISSSTSSLSNSEEGKDNTLFERERLLISSGNGGSRHNGGFHIPETIANKKRKSSSSSLSKNSNNSSRKENSAFGHQSTLLRVSNSSEEDVL